MKQFSGEPWAAFAVLFFATALWYSCSAAAEDFSNVSTSSMLTTEYEAPCLNVNFCRQAAVCCPTGVDTLILLCVDKVMKLRPDEPKYLVG
ncbi:PREDICTED: transmembrane protein 213 [Fulmarus glacialis]|uniref:transmembrane protein 213 n=1 Tax=Fulmarus glacialis TaxID=30455 RepID=UPI00051C58FA|nr:PREDICTED: transmembrane protein 213 [Fulmarus glacialis]